jgi:hypothetical protein
MLSMNETANEVYDKAGEAPWIAVISNLRQSAGRYSIDWTREKVEDRPELILANVSGASSPSASQENLSYSTSLSSSSSALFASSTSSLSTSTSASASIDARLVAHPAMACRLAFIQPIRYVKCAFESDSVWQFGSPSSSARNGRSASISNPATYHELNARSSQAEEYRKTCRNVDGITVLDLLLAASDT